VAGGGSAAGSVGGMAIAGEYGTGLLLFSDKHRVTADIRHALPLPAWTRLSDLGAGFPPGFYKAGVTGPWIVYAAWAAIGLAVAMTAVDRRDL
jgi:hypothetical protein